MRRRPTTGRSWSWRERKRRFEGPHHQNSMMPRERAGRSVRRRPAGGEGDVMGRPFKGIVSVDIRDSVPDWEPYTQPIAPEGSPNFLYQASPDVFDDGPVKPV